VNLLEDNVIVVIDNCLWVLIDCQGSGAEKIVSRVVLRGLCLGWCREDSVCSGIEDLA